MYIPSSFKFEELQEQIAFMKQYSFASIITYNGSKPIATHLPFIIEKRDGKIYLKSHFASINEQTKYIVDNISLVIFSEPHAYISPTHYDKWESVPTWDYISLHVYGKSVYLESDQEKLNLLKETILFYEKDYQDRWDSLNEKYKNGMIKGIIAFELEVIEIQGQKKLSQNKSIEERNRIIQTLEQSQISIEKDLAAYIKKV